MGLLKAAFLVGMLQCAAGALDSHENSNFPSDQTRSAYSPETELLLKRSAQTSRAAGVAPETESIPVALGDRKHAHLYASGVAQAYDSDDRAIITHLPKPVTEPYVPTTDASEEKHDYNRFVVGTADSPPWARSAYEWRCDALLTDRQCENKCQKMRRDALDLENQIDEAYAYKRNSLIAPGLDAKFRALKKEITDLRQSQQRSGNLPEAQRHSATFRKALDFWKRSEQTPVPAVTASRKTDSRGRRLLEQLLQVERRATDPQ